ncbi:tRNA uridine-5-carboxymethylaminomethyl(34) synthesis GTPase MnmE [Rhizobium sp.]|jgi:tRNA modification GTPase|uniref:tRNA uridine-5-carboxymethylaminomethyl(34) synthesis GTPase MnmE n=1 Tax=Rhizobium sp. TaxID=391 RepID=UPI000E893D7B|nr:tRNA uridine-5-carboxymethylaminomethyl(34) synthesis GTPase MnmE [Rhizobium sp.]
MATDTIFALSTGSLPCGVAVIRLSGPRVQDVLASICGAVPEPRFAALKSIRSRDGLIIDRGLVLFFPGPASFTGEDCAEFHVHGSRAVVAALLARLGEEPRCRLADAGEFSRRAFENGKLDLVEVEGLADLLAAETEMQRRQAIEQADGKATEMYNGWRERLIYCRAMIEADLDFSDEGDIPGSVADRAWDELSALRQSVYDASLDERRGEIIRDGFNVVIAGRPNAGKSSLLNALAGRDVAIVTHYAGTTRDIIQCDIDLEGYVVRLYDTAGIRETDEDVEREGIRRALRKIEEADLVLYLQDMTEDDDAVKNHIISVPYLSLGTKADLVGAFGAAQFDLTLSSHRPEDVARLRSVLLETIRTRIGSFESVIPSRLRHIQCLKQALEYIDCASDGRLGLEIRADYLRMASDCLGRLIGRVDTETLLGKIFSEFCVGK